MPPEQTGNELGYANWLDQFCELSYEEQEMARRALEAKRAVGDWHKVGSVV